MSSNSSSSESGPVVVPAAVSSPSLSSSVKASPVAAAANIATAGSPFASSCRAASSCARASGSSSTKHISECAAMCSGGNWSPHSAHRIIISSMPASTSAPKPPPPPASAAVPASAAGTAGGVYARPCPRLPEPRGGGADCKATGELDWTTAALPLLSPLLSLSLSLSLPSSPPPCSGVRGTAEDATVVVPPPPVACRDCQHVREWAAKSATGKAAPHAAHWTPGEGTSPSPAPASPAAPLSLLSARRRWCRCVELSGVMAGAPARPTPTSASCRRAVAEAASSAAASLASSRRI